MSYWLGQQLSDKGGPGAADPLKDRVWLLLQTIVTFVSLYIAFGFLDDWGNRSLLVAGGILVIGSSLLWLLFIRRSARD